MHKGLWFAVMHVHVSALHTAKVSEQKDKDSQALPNIFTQHTQLFIIFTPLQSTYACHDILINFNLWLGPVYSNIVSPELDAAGN